MMLVHVHAGAAGRPRRSRTTRAWRQFRTEYDVKQALARARPRGAGGGRVRRPGAGAPRPSRNGSRTSPSTSLEDFAGDVGVRLLHGELPRDDGHPVHRLQSARPAAGARQGAVEEAARLSTASRCRSSPCSRTAGRCGRRGASRYPVIVKSLTEEGSVGIAQASYVENAEQLQASASHSSTTSSRAMRSPSSTSTDASFTSPCSATPGSTVLPIRELVFRRRRPRAAHGWPPTR
ncbi:MAG: hypothetical protein MZW92_48290 [Comamonadaceae bacterium]|nr:hypothetical protein [Comamonadaceae bacterium]